MSAPTRLAAYESFAPAARETALKCFGKSLGGIERLLGKPSPGEPLRDELALLLWKYARGQAGQDGAVRELPSQVSRRAAAISVTARSLHDALQGLVDAYTRDDVAAATVAIALAAGGVDTTAVLEQLEVILSATGKIERSKGGAPADVEYGLLMYRVAQLFEAATGKPAEVKWNTLLENSPSPFFKMAKAVEQAAAAATQRKQLSDRALQSRLKKILVRGTRG
jgi:hypothetical protein